MKNLLMLLAVLAIAAPALAGDGQVSQSDLSSLGLGQMKSMSDAQGMTVRGLAAKSSGASLVYGQLVDPHTGSFVAGSSVNFSKGEGSVIAGQANSSSLDLGLANITPTSFFVGGLTGGAGGFGGAIGFFNP